MASDTSASRDPAAAVSPGRVLCVDDTPENLDLLEAMLRHRGYEVLRATTGGEGLRLARERLPDAILLDVMMPGLDGFAVCRLLKADAGTQDIPVIFLTARSDESEDVIRGLEIGAMDYITKPFRRGVLLARVSASVTHKRALDQRAALHAALKDAYVSLEAQRSEFVRAEKRAALGLLASGVAHEVNNPAAFVRANLGVLRAELAFLRERALAARDPAACAHDVDAMVARIEEMSALCEESEAGLERIVAVARDLTTLSTARLASGATVELGDVTRRAVSLAGAAVRDVAELVQELHDAVRVRAAEGDLAQILLAVLRNAVDAVAERGAGRGTVRVLVRAEGDDAMLVVEDDGVGVPEHALGRVADPYFTTKPFGQGRGMGLAVASQLARSMGGTLAIERIAEGGTRVSLRLPRVA